jgi:hypothetical protein
MTEPTMITFTNVAGEDETVTLDDFVKLLRTHMTVGEITVSCGETWQKRQFEPKNYHLTMKTDLTALYRLIDDVPREQQVLAQNALTQAVRERMISNDKFQRSIIRFLAQMDGIEAASKDIQDRRCAEIYQEGHAAAGAGTCQTDNPYTAQAELPGIRGEEGVLFTTSWNRGWTDGSAA